MDEHEFESESVRRKRIFDRFGMSRDEIRLYSKMVRRKKAADRLIRYIVRVSGRMIYINIKKNRVVAAHHYKRLGNDSWHYTWIPMSVYRKLLSSGCVFLSKRRTEHGFVLKRNYDCIHAQIVQIGEQDGGDKLW